MKNLLRIALLAAAIVPANAGVVFSDLDVGNAYSIIGGYHISDTQPVGMTFTAPTDFQLGEIDLALSAALFSSTNDGLQVSLNADNSGSPGAVLSSWTLNNLPLSTVCCTLQKVVPASPLNLTLGSLYWVLATTLDPTANFVWNFNLVGVTTSGPAIVPALTSTPFLLGAFQVTAIPEPGSIALCVGGLALILLGKFRRK
jgi:hypothetical protein